MTRRAAGARAAAAGDARDSYTRIVGILSHSRARLSDAAVPSHGRVPAPHGATAPRGQRPPSAVRWRWPRRRGRAPSAWLGLSAAARRHSSGDGVRAGWVARRAAGTGPPCSSLDSKVVHADNLRGQKLSSSPSEYPMPCARAASGKRVVLKCTPDSAS